MYNAGKFNFSVLEWAIKEIVKEEREFSEAAQKRKEKKAKELAKKANG